MNERGVLVCVRNHAYDPDPASAPVASGRPRAGTSVVSADANGAYPAASVSFANRVVASEQPYP